MILTTGRNFSLFQFLHIFISTCHVFGQTSYTKVHHTFDLVKNQSRCLILTQEILQKNLQFQNVDGKIVFIKEFVIVGVCSGNNVFQIFIVKNLTQPRSLLIQMMRIFLQRNHNWSKSFTSHFHNKMSHIIHEKKIEKICDSIYNLNWDTQFENLTRLPKSFKRDNIIKLVDGDSSSHNRIDVVFMGDGYTEKERPKFFADIKRLVQETFYTSTFSEFLPLLNVWGIFRPSVESGISYPGRPKNTTFALYRPSSGVPRGVYIRNPNTARNTCRQIGPSGCDYPVIIANDEYYGGLGGEFAISTSSPTSGSIVLRHELGHNFGRVGEEYDGGDVYRGANTASSLQNVGWRAWIDYNNNKNNNSSGSTIRKRPREERMTYRILSFPQNDLNKKELLYNFRSNGEFRGGGWFLTLTLSGAPEQGSVQFLLDGESLQWKSSGTMDKSIYSWTNNTHPLTRGKHTLLIAVTDKAIQNETSQPLPHDVVIRRAVGSVLFYEFGKPEEFHESNDIISAYPTWNRQGRRSYRPTNNGCLMRNMNHHQFCSVCKEGIWLQFMRRVSLIDDLVVSEYNSNQNYTTVNLRVVPLGQFRTSRETIEGERVEIRWTMNGQEQLELRDQLNINARIGQRDNWQVTTKLITPRIRNDPRNVTLDKKKFFIK